VAIVGANGHGSWHRRSVRTLQDRGAARLVALVDVAPVDTPGGVPVYTDHRAMLAAHRPDVVIVVTPPHTHLAIAQDVLRAGADLLLEKPPVLDLAQHDALVRTVRETGRACQIGFQALGSAALQAVLDADLGDLVSVAVAGAWWRPDSYWTRSPWSGRRSVDGALINAFAHALMQCLAITGPLPGARLEIERYRTRDIEVEDTACVRMSGAGPTLFAAVTLASEEFVAGDITVVGTRGTATLQYATDVVRLPGARPETVGGRVGLLENLLDHRATGAPLIAPPARTAPFTALVEAVNAAPPPRPVPAGLLVPLDDGVALKDAASMVRTAAATLSLLSGVLT
jgi:predicted dehydrogenase